MPWAFFLFLPFCTGRRLRAGVPRRPFRPPAPRGTAEFSPGKTPPHGRLGHGALRIRRERTESSATAHRKFGYGALEVWSGRTEKIFPSTWKYFFKYLENNFQVLGILTAVRSRQTSSALAPNSECAVAEAAVRRGRMERVDGPYFGRGGRQGLWGAAGCADAVSAGCACARSESGRGVSSSSFSGKAPLEL